MASSYSPNTYTNDSLEEAPAENITLPPSYSANSNPWNSEAGEPDSKTAQSASYWQSQQPESHTGYPMQNPGYSTENAGYPMQNPGYPMQDDEYPMQNPRYPMQNPGYPMQNPVYPLQNDGYPMQNPGYDRISTNDGFNTNDVAMLVPPRERVVTVRGRESFTPQIILSCFVFWCCCWPLGLAALHYAMEAKHKAKEENRTSAEKARQNGITSYRLSFAGIIIGLIILGINIGVVVYQLQKVEKENPFSHVVTRPPYRG